MPPIFRLCSKAFKVTFLLAISIVFALYFLQNSDKLKSYAAQKIIDSLEKKWNSKIYIKNNRINLFLGYISFSCGKIKPNISESSALNWSFSEATVYFSLSNLLLNGQLVSDIFLKNLKIKTDITRKGQLLLKNHLEKIFDDDQDSSLILRKVHLKNFHLILMTKNKDAHTKKRLIFILKGDLEFKKILPNDSWSGNLKISQGEINKNNISLFKEISGNSSIKEKKGIWESKNNFLFKTTNSHNFCLKAKSKNKDLIGKLTNNKTMKTEVRYLKDKLNIKGFIEIELFEKLLETFIPGNSFPKNILGNCKFDFEYQDLFCKPNGFGEINLSNIKVNELKVGNHILNFCHTDQIIEGSCLSKNLFNNNELSSKFSFNLTETIGKIKITNSKLFNLDKPFNVEILPQNLNFDLNINKSFSVSGTYNSSYLLKDLEKREDFSGGLLLNNEKINLSGKTNHFNFIINLSIKPHIHLSKLLYVKGKKKVISLNKKNKNNLILNGSFRFSFIKALLPPNWQRLILGKDSLIFLKLSQNNPTKISGFMCLIGGRISLTENYNPLENFSLKFEVDLKSKTLKIENSNLKFFKGTLSCNPLFLSLDDDYKINKLETKLLAKNLLINFKQNFYSFIDGKFFIYKKNSPKNKKPQPYKLIGDLILKKTLVKLNQFGNQDDEILNPYLDLNKVYSKNDFFSLDLNIISQDDVKIKADSLDLNSSLNLKCNAIYSGKNFYMQKATGSIKIESGSLNFFKNKLYINNGTIEFMPINLCEPIINLVAKNKIKNYLITFFASGPIQSPSIILESFPELSKEQIITLLMSGADSSNLQNQISDFLLKNLNLLINENKKKLTKKTSSFFKNLLLPFKYIHITPKFINSSEKSGVEGSIAIDFNKQINAQVQKSFNLHDDLTFHLEYLLTEDLNLKLLKDQAGEIGAQVELMFKL